MSVFDEIANDVPILARYASTLAVPPQLEHGDSEHFSAAHMRVEELILIAKHQHPTAFVKILRQTCLDEAYRDTLLQLSSRDAQVVVDAIQLALDELRFTDEFYRHALYLLVKLSANTNVLPTSLFVHGVAIGPSRDPCHGGAFADIYRGRYEGSEVAVKKLRFFGNQKAHIHQAFCKEALVWRQMAHPNVLPFIGVDAETFADTGFLCMISPWMANGSLLDYRRSESYDFDHDTSRILWEISCGLAYLHGQKVVHGDIHVANIFIDAEGHARLADFGLSIVGETTIGRMSSGSGTAGNPRYLAPERVAATQNMRRSTACDVYAFACVCLFLYTGKHPFQEYLKEVIVSVKIMNGERPSRPSQGLCRPDMTDMMWQLIKDAWHQNPLIRPSMLQLEERLRPTDFAVISARRTSSMMSGHRFSHRELVRLSTPQADATKEGSLQSAPPSRTHATPPSNVSVDSLSRGTATMQAWHGLEFEHQKRPVSPLAKLTTHEKAKYKDIIELLESGVDSAVEMSSDLDKSHMVGFLDVDGPATTAIWSTEEETHGLVLPHQTSSKSNQPEPANTGNMMKAMFLSKWPWSPSTSTLPADDTSELWSTVSNAFGNEVQLLVLGMYSAARERVLTQLSNELYGRLTRYALVDATREIPPVMVLVVLARIMRRVLALMPNMDLYVQAKNQGHRQTILGFKRIAVYHRQAQLMQSLAALGTDAGVTSAHNRLGSEELDDVSRYFLAATRRITKHRYKPTKTDATHLRAMYGDATELAFPVGELAYHVWDVGEPRMDTNKWSHYMLDVSAIVFVASLADYGEATPGCPTSTKLMESIGYFDSLCKSPWLQKTSIVLFLTDADTFREKLMKVPLGNVFNDYDGGDNFDAACDYILRRFVVCHQHPTDAKIYASFASQSDSEVVKYLLSAMQDILLQKHLRKYGLL